MKMFFHFALSNFSNTYLLGPPEGGDALIIDPGAMDLPLLNLIEDNNFYIKHILVTHNHKPHVDGIKTIKKIYEADVYSNLELPFDMDIIRINDGDRLELPPFEVDVINVPGHSLDSMVFKIKNMLFTGDVLFAGAIDRDLTVQQTRMLKENIVNRIFTLDDDLLIFPGHGSPTTVKAEKSFNPYLKDF